MDDKQKMIWDLTIFLEKNWFEGDTGMIAEALISAGIGDVSEYKKRIAELEAESADKERAYTEEYLLRKEFKCECKEHKKRIAVLEKVVDRACINKWEKEDFIKQAEQECAAKEEK